MEGGNPHCGDLDHAVRTFSSPSGTRAIVVCSFFGGRISRSPRRTPPLQGLRRHRLEPPQETPNESQAELAARHSVLDRLGPAPLVSAPRNHDLPRPRRPREAERAPTRRQPCQAATGLRSAKNQGPRKPTLGPVPVGGAAGSKAAQRDRRGRNQPAPFRDTS